MKVMSKAIEQTCRSAQPIRKVIICIPTHKLRNNKCRIKQWSSYGARLTTTGEQEFSQMLNMHRAS